MLLNQIMTTICGNTTYICITQTYMVFPQIVDLILTHHAKFPECYVIKVYDSVFLRFNF